MVDIYYTAGDSVSVISVPLDLDSYTIDEISKDFDIILIHNECFGFVFVPSYQLLFKVSGSLDMYDYLYLFQ